MVVNGAIFVNAVNIFFLENRNPLTGSLIAVHASPSRPYHELSIICMEIILREYHHRKTSGNGSRRPSLFGKNYGKINQSSEELLETLKLSKKIDQNRTSPDRKSRTQHPNTIIRTVSVEFLRKIIQLY